jgi:hypothetical protein
MDGVKIDKVLVSNIKRFNRSQWFGHFSSPFSCCLPKLIKKKMRGFSLTSGLSYFHKNKKYQDLEHDFKKITISKILNLNKMTEDLKLKAGQPVAVGYLS